MILTKERLEAIREDVNEAKHLRFSDYCISLLDEVDLLRAEIDSLRKDIDLMSSTERELRYANANLEMAMQALEFTLKNAYLCGHDDPTWCDDKCQVIHKAKEALAKIRLPRKEGT